MRRRGLNKSIQKKKKNKGTRSLPCGQLWEPRKSGHPKHPHYGLRIKYSTRKFNAAPLCKRGGAASRHYCYSALACQPSPLPPYGRSGSGCHTSTWAVVGGVNAPQRAAPPHPPHALAAVSLLNNCVLYNSA